RSPRTTPFIRLSHIFTRVRVSKEAIDTNARTIVEANTETRSLDTACHELPRSARNFSWAAMRLRVNVEESVVVAERPQPNVSARAPSFCHSPVASLAASV